MAVDNYAVKWGKDIKWVKHDKHRMRVKCKADHCKWILFASKIDEGDDSIAIKTIGPTYICGRTFYHKRTTSSFLARKYMDFLRMNKRITVAEFKNKVHAELNVNITKSQVYKTFMKAKILIHGSYKDQYNILWDYCGEQMKANPDSIVYMETTLNKDSEKQRFQRLYICFEALKRGFKSGCRKIIGVDGCHLRGPYPTGLGSAIQKVIPDVEHRQCQESESLVHHYYSQDSYLKAYEPAIVSLSGPNVWVQSDKDPILSPLKLKLPGRPKKVRRREPEEPRPNSNGATKLSKSGLIRMTYQVFDKELTKVPPESCSMPDVPTGDKAQAAIDEQEAHRLRDEEDDIVTRST
ncbi:uncharacterized protein [Coffea arabica]|uniref:Transposase MuDR plant domain-containing protein n=1 Tax=Coffea arabica TaxID=13443 RepID=A0ABM4UFY0_COFAR